MIDVYGLTDNTWPVIMPAVMPHEINVMNISMPGVHKNSQKSTVHHFHGIRRGLEILRILSFWKNQGILAKIFEKSEIFILDNWGNY